MRNLIMYKSGLRLLVLAGALLANSAMVHAAAPEKSEKSTAAKKKIVKMDKKGKKVKLEAPLEGGKGSEF